MRYYTLTVKTNQTKPLYFSKRATLVFNENDQVAFDENVMNIIKQNDNFKQHLIQRSNIYKIENKETLEVTTEFYEADLSIYTIEIIIKPNRVYYKKPRRNQVEIDSVEAEIKELRYELSELEDEISDMQIKADRLEEKIAQREKFLESLEEQS